MGSCEVMRGGMGSSEVMRGGMGSCVVRREAWEDMKSGEENGS